MGSLFRRFHADLKKCSQFGALSTFHLRAVTQGSNYHSEHTGQSPSRRKQTKLEKTISRVFQLDSTSLKENIYIKHLLKEVKSSHIVFLYTKGNPTYTNLKDILTRETSAHVFGKRPTTKELQNTTDETREKSSDEPAELILPEPSGGKMITSVVFFDAPDVSSKFLFSETTNLSSENGLYKDAQIQHIIFMEHTEFARLFSPGNLSNRNKWRNKRAVICNSLFAKKELVKVPKDDSRHKVKSKQKQQDNVRFAGYLVKLVPKRKVIASLKGDCVGFYYFCTRVTAKPNFRIVPLMEQLCPGIGEHLIMAGLCDMMQTVRDMKNRDFLNIFKAMVSSHHYKNSPFKLKLDDKEAKRKDEEKELDNVKEADGLNTHDDYFDEFYIGQSDDTEFEENR